MKKKEFLKNTYATTIGLPIFVMSFTILIVIVAVITTNNRELIPIIIFLGLVFLISLMVLLFYDKRTLSKIVLSPNGIEWKWLGKQITYIDWNDVTDINVALRGRGADDLAFISSSKKIEISLTKKIYKAIMDICPDPNIKLKINGIERFENFH